MSDKKRSVSIISFPSNLGLIEPSPGKEPGVKKLPESLRKSGFHEMFPLHDEINLDPPPYSMDLDPDTGVRNADAIAVYALKQASVIREIVSGRNFALVLGGDCSILIGNMIGLKQLGKFKLFFIDGHTDFMLPSLSSTHGAAGMDLAIVSGHGHERLSNINDYGPYIEEADVWCVGNREYDPDYVGAIQKTAIQYYDLKTLRKSGISFCIQSFFASLQTDHPDGFWVHLDVDVLDPLVMPAVDSPDPGGLTYPELNGMLESLLLHPLCRGLEITILDPELDPDGEIIRQFVAETGTTIQRAFDKCAECGTV
jgi:arginase